MPPQAASRKRPAPGTSPTMPEHQTSLQFPAQSSSPQLTNDEFLNWGNKAPTNMGSNVVSNAGSGYSESNAPYNSNIYHLAGGMPGMAQPSGVMHHHPPTAPSPPSNQVARRPVNQSLVSRTRAFGQSNANNLWSGDFGGDGTGDLQDISEWNTEEDMNERAQVAKREAQAKRKQIPPFVQKLSSFLDQSKNTDLIRWSDSGDSFIVLDEDEFAKTLIPELFKHNNYASFVRQLNMYGFHKKVGLSDNSMKASERKNKSPSEYHNPYFKRGHPDLLWLINKPKNSQSSNREAKKSGKKGGVKAEDGDRQSDDDGSGDENEDYPKVQSGQRDGSRGMSTAGSGAGGARGLTGPNDVGNALARRDLADVRSQLESIRQHQKAISTAINRLRKDHNQLYEQAVAFQTLHDRHESSINAILTFLATVYNRSLEGHGGQNFANMFGNAIPHEPQPQGNVVDVGDMGDQPQGGQIQRRFRRQPLRLTAPPNASQDAPTGRLSTVSPAASGSSAQAFQNNYNHGQQEQYLQPNQMQDLSQSGSIEELFDAQGLNQTVESPSIKPDLEGLNQSPTMPQRDILSIINSANATNNMQGARFDFGSALSHYENANGQSPLTPKQRNAMLHLIANNANVSSGSSNNALLSPTPPPMPSLEQFSNTQQELEMLAKLQAEQDAKYLIGQGLEGGAGAGALDLDQIFNSGDYFSNHGNGEMDFVNDAGFGDGVDLFSGNGDGANDMHGFDGVREDQNGRVVEALDSSESTSPANTIDTPEDSGSPSKRRRRA